MSGELAQLTITEASLRFREGNLKPSELAEAHLDAISARDGEIRAFLDVFSEDARRDAVRADQRYAEGSPRGALDGIPVAVKDNILVAGHRCTAGSKILEPYRASYDATAVARLKDAGAVILGKTNLDEFAMGSSTEHSAFGPTRNPLDVSRVPGGSSGGSAAAVGAGFCVAALGSETGGSIRQPAAFCGVVGLKPTYGRVSRSGLIAMASSLDQIGPLGRTVEDVETLFSAIAGHDPLDATTHSDKRASESASERGQQREGVLGLRVGLPKEYFGEGLDERIRSEVLRAVDVLRAQGATVEEVSLPHAPSALAVYYLVMPSEVSANLARFDGIRYGASTLRNKKPARIRLRANSLAGGQETRNKPEDFWQVYFKTRQKYFGEEAKRRIMLGTFALSSGYYDAYYARAQKVRALIRQDFDRALASVDVLVTPTAPTLPFRFGERTEEPLAMYLADIYTVSANLAGIPALSVPFGRVEEGGAAFSAGVQVIGKPFDEATLFAVGKAVEEGGKAA